MVWVGFWGQKKFLLRIIIIIITILLFVVHGVRGEGLGGEGFKGKEKKKIEA